MATNTTNYNWKKPDYEDDADIKDLNDNFDDIDAQVKAIDDQVQLNKNNILSKCVVCTCSTASATAAKIVDAPSGFVLQEGCIIGVKFSYSNGSTTDNVTLNVNGTGAKPIYYQNGVYTSHATKVTGYANFYIFYMYDGTNWVWLNYSFDSTYSDMSQSEASAGTATNGRVISAKVLSDTIDEKLVPVNNNISLLEQMNGAKNKFNYEAWKNCGVYNGAKTVNGNSFTIVASGDDCFTYYENSEPRQYPINARIPCNAGDTVVITWDYTPLSNQTDDRVGIFANGSSSTGFFALTLASDKKLVFTAPTGITYLSIRFGIRSAGNSATYGNIQIQSKVSYDAGFTDYQPYAMSNAELTATIQALQAQLANQ